MAKALSASVTNRYHTEFAAHLETVEAARNALADPFASLVHVCLKALRDGGKLVLFGNGGSAADAQHIATELTVRYVDDRAAIPAIALTTDTSALTAIGNDFGFDALFSRQVEALVQSNDVAIGLSTSGNSQNVLLGLKAAKKRGAVAAGFCGRSGGAMHGVAEPLLVVPSQSTPRIQEVHILLGHMLCDALESELGYV